MVVFRLRLEHTYWSKGFFNVPVDFERYLSHDDGPVDIFLGNARLATPGRMTRTRTATGPRESSATSRFKYPSNRISRSATACLSSSCRGQRFESAWRKQAVQRLSVHDTKVALSRLRSSLERR